MNVKYRLKFSKTDKMRFIGHLDLLTLFQRSIKRAGLPIAYSLGFNPHQLMSFALPLSLGVASLGEYIDLELSQELNPEEMTHSLNKAMPDGITILKSRMLESGEKKCAAAVEVGIYHIVLKTSIDLEKVISEFLSKKEIEISRIIKHKEKTVDIRPAIFELEDISTEGETILKAIIATGSGGNLKPDVLIKTMYAQEGVSYDPFEVKYTRIELLKKDDNEHGLVSLYES